MAIQKALISLINGIVNVLPKDPFPAFLDELHDAMMPYLGWLNWVIPISSLEKIFVAWLGAVAVWYVWRSLAGFLHMVQ